MKIAITGASGFIGRALINSLGDSGHEILALSRSTVEVLPKNAEWKFCELFSTQSTAEALVGVDVVFYLVHSMLPSSRLFQGDFHDTDLLIADNIAKSCVANKVKKIIYLGGVIPEGFISQHLQSREEVEGVLKATGIDVTVFRSGMIVGVGGSSFEILKSLMLRLPIMILPEWTKRKTQAIHLDDVVRTLNHCIGNKEYKNSTFNLVNGESLCYEDLMRKVARALSLTRIMIPVPINSTGFSKLWVTWFGQSHYSLVSPLIDSLACDLPQVQPLPLIEKNIKFKTFDSMLTAILNQPQKQVVKNTKKVLQKKNVRSIQRLPSLPQKNSDWIAREYMNWLPKEFKSFIKVDVDRDSHLVGFRLFFMKKPLLLLKFIEGRYDEDRQKFHIIGGLLTNTNDTGWLEFRQIQNKKYTLSAIHEFVPSLPWFVYVCSQAPVHKLVMNTFGRYLKQFQVKEA